MFRISSFHPARFNRIFVVMFPLAIAAMLGGCSALPNVADRLQTAWLYHHPPKFVGVHGPLTPEQGATIIDHLEARSGAVDILHRQLAIEQAIGAGPLLLDNKVTLLKNGSETYKAMFAAIAAATNNICLETFTFADDPVGNRFADALIAKQRQGVQVNVIYDAAGSFLTSDSFMEHMRAAGVRIISFNPISPFARRFSGRLTHRDHRKILTVDGKIGFTGGVNIASVYSAGTSIGKPAPKSATLDYWRDTDVMIEGPADAEMQQLFLATWERQKGRPLSPRDYFPAQTRQGHVIVSIIDSRGRTLSMIYTTLISAINNAAKNVYITDAYFAPDWQMQGALKAAAHRGVDVRLLLPKQSDHTLIVSAARAHYAGLLKAGVKVYEWQGVMLHAKTATIDGVWSTVGSSNLDWWSIERNSEINAVMLSTDFGARMNQMFFDDLKDSQQIEPAVWRQRPLTERAEQWMARLLEPIL